MKIKTYTQKEIREAHERVTKDLKNAYATYKGVALAIECQEMVLEHLTSIMEPEEKKEEETPKEELDVNEASKE